jgi:LmbE family N-acetylglucosaminyl deacetylase
MNKSQSRRDFINRSAAGAALIGIQGIGLKVNEESTDKSDTTADRKLKIIVTGGHPGDPEYGCGGTIALYTEMGHEVVMLYLNRGEGGIGGKTGKEAAAIRTAEALRAASILRSKTGFATQIDGQSVIDASHYKEFYELLEAEKPDIIFTQWPIDNHRDHRAIFNLVYDAWLDLGRTGSAKLPDLYYYEVSDGEDTFMYTPDCYVDITSKESIKRDACFAHASQSPEMFYSLQEQVSRFRGLECGCKHAEAFKRQIKFKSELPPPLK